MRRFCLFLSFLVLIFIAAGPAHALTVTVGDNIADNLYMASGARVNGSFDIKPELLPAELYNSPYDIQSGSYVFSFVDDYDLAYERTYHTSWSGHDDDWDDETFYRREYRVFSDAAESVKLEVTGNDYYDGTDHYFTQIYTGNYNVDKDSDYFWGFKTDTDTYITYIYNETNGYKGQFTITNGLSDEDILALSQGGSLDFSITASGDIVYANGRLTVDVNANPVPEPATLFLLGAGLLGVGGFRKKRK